MNLYQNLEVLTQGLIETIIAHKTYEKDDYFMNLWNSDEQDLYSALHDYIGMEKYCFFLKRKNLFYRTTEELNDIFSAAFIEAFFRNKAYPLKSTYKGMVIGNGSVRTVRLSKWLKDSLQSKIITINVKFHEERVQEISEHRITNKDGEEFGFEDFLSMNGVESLPVSLSESADLDECNNLLLELSKEIYPQVSYVMLLKNYEISQDDFHAALRCQLNMKASPEYLSEKYDSLTDVIGKVILNNKEKLRGLFGSFRLEKIAMA